MANLKLITYIFLLSVVLFQGHVTEHHSHEGVFAEIDDSAENNHHHCSDHHNKSKSFHSKTEENHSEKGNWFHLQHDQHEHHCCNTSTKVIEHCAVIEKSNSKELKGVFIPNLTQTYFIELLSQFKLSLKESVTLDNRQLFYRTKDFDLPLHSSTSYYFTSTILLLI